MAEGEVEIVRVFHSDGTPVDIASWKSNVNLTSWAHMFGRYGWRQTTVRLRNVTPAQLDLLRKFAGPCAHRLREVRDAPREHRAQYWELIADDTPADWIDSWVETAPEP